MIGPCPEGGRDTRSREFEGKGWSHKTSEANGSRKRQREKSMQNLNFHHWNCGYSSLDSWTSVTFFCEQIHVRSSHAPPHHFPLLFRVAHSTLNEIEWHERQGLFLQPSWSIGVMGLLFCHRLLLMFKYTATLKHWSDHVLTNSACKYDLI